MIVSYERLRLEPGGSYSFPPVRIPDNAKCNMASISDNKKSRGRPPTTGTGTLIGVRLQPDQLAALDAWIAARPDPKPSRPEAIRVILGEHVA
jgi:hypothetical protein